MTAKQIIAKRKELWNKDIEQDKQYREAVAKKIMESESLREEIQDHPEYLIEMVFVIVDKDKKTVPFFLNDVQQEFVLTLNDAIEQQKSGLIHNIKILVLKGRQQGFTSFITAYQLACTLTRKNFDGFTAADEDGNTTTIFQNKAKYTYSYIPECLKPTEKFNNRKQLLFEKINSAWEVKTASNNMGRSRTINFFHGSEAAFWKANISDVQAGLGEALTKNAIQILESTANGFNEFKDLWDNGKWINCFYEWWKTKEYRHNFETPGKEKRFKSDVENKHDWIYERCRWLSTFLDWEQVYWYFNKHEGHINKELIKQEYPCTPQEAFLASGKCVFDTEKVVQRIAVLREKYKKESYKTGYFEFEWNNGEYKDFIKDETIKFIESKTRPIVRLYEQPKQGYPYTIGGDTKGEGRDSYAATVKNNNTGTRCATLKMDINHSKPYTHQVYCLGRYFNTALIGIEVNWNTAPIEELERLHYPKQYQRQRYDNFEGKYYNAYGWRTDGTTRPIMIDREVELVENRIELINDIETLEQMLTFILDDKNRPDAESGKHDDLLFSDMISEETSIQQTHIIEKHYEYDCEEDDDEYQHKKGWFN